MANIFCCCQYCWPNLLKIFCACQDCCPIKVLFHCYILEVVSWTQRNQYWFGILVLHLDWHHLEVISFTDNLLCSTYTIPVPTIVPQILPVPFWSWEPLKNIWICAKKRNLIDLRKYRLFNTQTIFLHTFVLVIFPIFSRKDDAKYVPFLENYRKCKPNFPFFSFRDMHS